MYRRAAHGDIGLPRSLRGTRRYCSGRGRRSSGGSSDDPDAPPPLTLAASVSLPASSLVIVAVAAFLAGAINAIAGGGTLLTFPSLIAAGLSPLVANATSTVALLPASLSSMLGYREELAGSRKWTIALTLPSLVGGGLGALLLLYTPGSTFDRVVPWLVLGATGLFLIQRPLLSWIRRHEAASVDEAVLMKRPPGALMLLGQAVGGVYGGYFGAGVGIVMLAVLGFMGLSNIHRMNGLKNWAGFCMNAVAAVIFALSGIVAWPVALIMAVGSIAGGYVGSRVAQRFPQGVVRGVVAVVGLTSGVWLLLRHH
jgi:uncharacterized membrane protein YfcA